MVRDAGPVHLTVPQRRGFTKSLPHRLGHITEEEEDASLDDLRQRDARDKDNIRMHDSKEKFHSSRSRSTHRNEDDDGATDDDYNEDDDDEASSDDDYSHRNRNGPAPVEEGVPYHYFANHLVKPFFVTSQRYGSFQTMTARYKSSFPLPRPNVRISKSLPRPVKHMEYGKPFRRGVTLTWRNRFSKPENMHSFERPYLKHELNGRSGETAIYSQSPRSLKANEVMPEYELCHDYSEVLAHSPAVKTYEGRRPLSPVQDYSSSESGISDDYRMAFKTSKKSSSRNSGTTKTSSSDESNRLHKRRKSSSADSAMRDFDVLSSCSSGAEENNGDEVFSGTRYKTHGSPRSGSSAARSSHRRVSVSSSNSNSSAGVKSRHSRVRRSGKERRSQTEERRADNVSHRKNIEEIDTRWLQQEVKLRRSNKISDTENTWPQLKSCLTSDDYKELETITSLHNDSYEARRRSMPNRDISLDSDCGDLNRTSKSSRSASHKSVAFADDTLDTSLADTSSKNMSKSLADIINTSLTDGTYSSRKTVYRSRSSPADPDHEVPSSKSNTQGETHTVHVNKLNTRDETQHVQANKSNTRDETQPVQANKSNTRDETQQMHANKSNTQGEIQQVQANKSNTQGETQPAHANNNSPPYALQKATALQKNGRSYSSDSFLSSSNCTDKIKRLQDILIKQALPFARPDNLLPTQPKRITKADVSLEITDNGQSHEAPESVSLNTQMPETSPAKLHGHSKSEGDLAINNQTMKQQPARQATKLESSEKNTSSVTVSDNKMPGTEPAILPSQKPEHSSAVLPPPPPPPPPPAPPLPASFMKTAVGEASTKTQDSKSKSNISIIKINQTTTVKSKTMSKASKS